MLVQLNWDKTKWILERKTSIAAYCVFSSNMCVHIYCICIVFPQVRTHLLYLYCILTCAYTSTVSVLYSHMCVHIYCICIVFEKTGCLKTEHLESYKQICRIHRDLILFCFDYKKIRRVYFNLLFDTSDLNRIVSFAQA